MWRLGSHFLFFSFFFLLVLGSCSGGFVFVILIWDLGDRFNLGSECCE